MNILIETYAEQARREAETQSEAALQFWRGEAKQLRSLWEEMIQAALKGEAVTIFHRDKQVKLIPENTALRMTGDIP